jgi:hypothetical protein
MGNLPESQGGVSELSQFRQIVLGIVRQEAEPREQWPKATQGAAIRLNPTQISWFL